MLIYSHQQISTKNKMAKQKNVRAALLAPTPQRKPITPARTISTKEAMKPVVQTVKVPQDVYVRLKTLGARERRSSQDIILSAIQEYLERFPTGS
jgi:hypothetical protein